MLSALADIAIIAIGVAIGVFIALAAVGAVGAYNAERMHTKEAKEAFASLGIEGVTEIPADKPEASEKHLPRFYN